MVGSPVVDAAESDIDGVVGGKQGWPLDVLGGIEVDDAISVAGLSDALYPRIDLNRSIKNLVAGRDVEGVQLEHRRAINLKVDDQIDRPARPVNNGRAQNADQRIDGAVQAQIVGRHGQGQRGFTIKKEPDRESSR